MASHHHRITLPLSLRPEPPPTPPHPPTPHLQIGVKQAEPTNFTTGDLFYTLDARVTAVEGFKRVFTSCTRQDYLRVTRGAFTSCTRQDYSGVTRVWQNEAT